MALQNIVILAIIAILSVHSVTAMSPLQPPTKAPVAAPKSAPPPPQAMTPPAPPPPEKSSPPSAEPSPDSTISATPADAPGPSASGGESLKVGISGAFVWGLLTVVLVMQKWCDAASRLC